MLSHHVGWHLRQCLAPMLDDDADSAAAETLQTSVVAKAQRSPSAVAKQSHGTTPDGLPVQSLQSLLVDLATLARKTVTTSLNPAHEFVVHTRPTKLQQKASTSSPSVPPLVPSSSPGLAKERRQISGLQCV
jgi:hypothetical protein